MEGDPHRRQFADRKKTKRRGTTAKSFKLARAH